jgi:hypothetical protein
MRISFLKLFITGVIFFSFSSLLFNNDVLCQIQVIKKNGGSVYSVFGIGDINYSESGRSDAMGILGIGLMGNYTNSLNPATWTGSVNTRFSTIFNLANIRSTDGSDNAKRTYANFEGFNFTVPINRNYGWVFNLGLHTYSVVSYDVSERGTSIDENYTRIFSGSGGLSRISLGFSYLLFKDFSFGIQFNYAFGNISKEDRIIWDNSALFNTDNTTANSLSGYYFNTGLVFHGFDKLFKSKSLNNLNVAALFTTPMRMSSNVTGRFDRVTGADSVGVTDGQLSLPLAFGFGISNEFKNNLVIAADVYYQNWDKYKYYNVHESEFQNSLRVGGGFEFTPSRRFEDPFLSKASYRLGANYNTGYLKLDGKSISSFGLNAGISLPMSKFNSFDITFGYSRRGTTVNGLVLDNYYKLGLAVDIGELWFIRGPGE